MARQIYRHKFSFCIFSFAHFTQSPSIDLSHFVLFLNGFILLRGAAVLFVLSSHTRIPKYKQYFLRCGSIAKLISRLYYERWKIKTYTKCKRAEKIKWTTFFWANNFFDWICLFLCVCLYLFLVWLKESNWLFDLRALRNFKWSISDASRTDQKSQFGRTCPPRWFECLEERKKKHIKNRLCNL